MAQQLSRRQFLVWNALGLSGLFLPKWARLGENAGGSRVGLGRVAVPAINVYQAADFRSERAGKCEKDEILVLLEEVTSPAGPTHNPIWYRIADGYVHSGRIQRVAYYSHPPLRTIPAAGILGEVIVPYTQAYRWSRAQGWQKLYRLYHSSLHWIVSLDEGPNGQPYYRVLDNLMNAEYHVRARDLRPMYPEEYSPLGQDVPPEEKRIEVSIQDQLLVAYAGDEMVLSTKISSGVHTDEEDLPEGALPTDTPLGAFNIQLKMPSRHMGDGYLTADLDAYELPGVPWAMAFQQDGVALHGTYWHNNFGTKMSHGCVNLRNADALFLFRWTEPAFTLAPTFSPASTYVQGKGTRVLIREKFTNQ